MKQKLILKLWKSKGELYWHLASRNGNILCDGGESYQRRRFMERAIFLTLTACNDICWEEFADHRPDIRVEDTIPHGKK